MDASRDTAGQRAGSPQTSSASSMEFSSNTGMFFRTRLRKRHTRVAYLCSEQVSPSDAGTNPSLIFTSRFAESCEAGSATTRAYAPRSSIAHGSIQTSEEHYEWLAQLVVAARWLSIARHSQHQFLGQVRVHERG